MWEVKCSRCGGIIEAESPKDIDEDVNGDPRHEDCEYADKPDFPTTINISTSSPSVEGMIRSHFPYLVPKIDKNAIRDIVPSDFRSMGSLQCEYFITSDGGLWEANFDLIRVDGELLAESIPRVIYECEECGTRIDGRIAYNAGGHLPLLHDNCEARQAEFVPVELSHLNRNDSLGEKILSEYESD